MNRVLLIGLLSILALTTCIDPYTLKLDNYESLLVVDALVTQESIPYTIKLSRTFQDRDTLPDMVTNALVNMEDSQGNVTVFHEVSPGIYKSDPTNFTGQVGEIYTLNIKTSDGLEYESDPCVMTEVPEVDSIYFAYDKEFFNNGTEEEEGIRIFVDAGNEGGISKYFRWEFEEVWKFRTPYPEAYEYLGNGNVLPIEVENHVCWSYNNSSEILIQSTDQQVSTRINKKPLNFIASGRTDRLRIQYSILVKQYSISKSEFEFWSNLKQVNESGGDIFEKQPFSVVGNIHCVNRQNQKVLGYFQVSDVKQKRRYITYIDLYKLGIPSYHYSCNPIEIGPIDYLDPEVTGQQNPPTFDQIYQWNISKGYVFVYALYNNLSLERLAFATKICSDCSLTGDPQKPEWWVDKIY